MVELYQKVELKTGETAVIVEILKVGEAFLADIEKGEQEYETDEIRIEDIKSVFVETKIPLVSAV